MSSWLLSTYVVLTVSAASGPLRGSDEFALAGEFALAMRDFDQAQDLRAGAPDQARRLYGAAAQRLESLAAAGVRNGYLEYNLGNAYLQQGDTGRAILHYRRAQRLIPRDPYLAENLSVARGRSLLSIPPARGSAIYRNLFFWHFQTSPRGRFIAALVCYIALWTFLGIRSFVRLPGLGVASGVSALLCVAAGGSLAVQHWQDRNAPDAVMVAADVPVFKGPAATYQKQFEQALQPGVEVVVLEERGDWRRVQLSDGGSGWVARDAVELVPENTGDQVSLPGI